MKLKISLLTCLFCLCLIVSASAQIPQTINYQGSLKNVGDGTPVNGAVDMTFKLCDSLSGGTCPWTETQSVAVSNGIYSVILGNDPTNPLSGLAFDAPYYLEVAVNETTLSPRQQLTAVPYAFKAAAVEGITVIDGNVGIGTDTPSAKLSLDNISDSQEFGHSAFYLDEGAWYFDHEWVFTFRGNGLYHGARFTATANREDDADIVGIYAEETTPGTPGDPIAVFLNNGNVGIGTDTPSAKLTLDNIPWNPTVEPQYFGKSAIYIGEGGYYFDYEWGFGFRTNSENRGAKFTATSNMKDDGQIVGIYEEETSPGLEGDPIAVFLNNGNVGIGTDTPSAKLTLDNIPWNPTVEPQYFGKSAIYIGEGGYYFDYEWGFGFRTNSRNLGAKFTATSNMKDDGQIVGIYKEETSPGLEGDPIAVFLNNGNVGIGTADPQYTLDVAGPIRGNSFSPSDARWKENVQPLDNALEQVSQLQGVSFTWKDTTKGEGQQIGLIAQDVEPVFPEVVSTDSDGYKSVAYDKLVAPLIEAVKTLKAENKELKQRVTVLEKALKKQQ